MVLGLPKFCEGFTVSRKDFEPIYMETYRSGKIWDKLEMAREMLRKCCVCPRNCDVNRLENELGSCASGRYAEVSSYFPHFGEEDCLRGWKGSGTIFFTHCNLKCVFCALPETLIATECGLMRIDEVFDLGDEEVQWHGGFVRFLDGKIRIYGGDGYLAPATKAFRHFFSGEVVQIKPYNFPPIVLTPNHEVFTVHRSAPDRIVKVRADSLTKDYFLIVPKRKPANADVILDVYSILASATRPTRQSVHRHTPIGQLSELFTLPLRSYGMAEITGYHSAYVRKLWRQRPNGSLVVPTEELDPEVFEENGTVRIKGENCPGIPTKIPLDKYLAWLIGIYCAKGHVISYKKGHLNITRLMFSFGHKETVMANRTATLLRELFGVEPNISWRRTTLTVEVDKASLALLFSKLCGGKAKEKQIPPTLLKVKPEVIRSFLQGIFDGGGRDLGTHHAVDTVSENLAMGLFELGLLVGILPSFHSYQPPSTGTIKGRTVQRSPLLHVKFPKSENGRQPTKCKERGDYFLVPIYKIKHYPYEGWVFNLELNNSDHSYLAPFVTVANCQNFDISRQGIGGHIVTPEELAHIMLYLQDLGCHNINFVTPEHVTPQIMEAIPIAIEKGLHLPIVYNTSAYDSMESLKLMEDIVDIYMPDFKYWDASKAKIYLKAENYPESAKQAIKEMHRQVGYLTFDGNGLALRGVLIRHLIMPDALDDTKKILTWIASELGTDSYVNIMEQYHPAGLVSDKRYPEINRRITDEEYERAIAYANEVGLWRLDYRWRKINLIWL